MVVERNRILTKGALNGCFCTFECTFDSDIFPNHDFVYVSSYRSSSCCSELRRSTFNDGPIRRSVGRNYFGQVVVGSTLHFHTGNDVTSLQTETSTINQCHSGSILNIDISTIYISNSHRVQFSLCVFSQAVSLSAVNDFQRNYSRSASSFSGHFNVLNHPTVIPVNSRPQDLQSNRVVNSSRCVKSNSDFVITTFSNVSTGSSRATCIVDQEKVKHSGVLSSILVNANDGLSIQRTNRQEHVRVYIGVLQEEMTNLSSAIGSYNRSRSIAIEVNCYGLDIATLCFSTHRNSGYLSVAVIGHCVIHKFTFTATTGHVNSRILEHTGSFRIAILRGIHDNGGRLNSLSQCQCH